MKTCTLLVIGTFTALAVVATPLAAGMSPGLPGFPNVQNRKQVSANRALGKRSASTELKWRQIGSSHYSNDSYSSTPPTWSLLTRDTSIYNASGDLIVSKTTYAHSGWPVDSLESLDSSVYSGGQEVESIHRYYSTYGGGSGYRYTYRYVNGDKSFVYTEFSWDPVRNSWIPASRDSIVYTVPFGDSLWSAIYSGLSAEYFYTYDTLSSMWKDAGILSRIDNECSSTRLTLEGLVPWYGGSSTSEEMKIVMDFSSSDWTFDNMISETIEKKDSVTGRYYDYYRVTTSADIQGAKTTEYAYWDSTTGGIVPSYKYTYTYDANGFETSSQYFRWDSVSSRFVPSSKYLSFPDRHGNDTLSFSCTYNSDASTWDTNSWSRYARTYDINGNNLETIESFRSSSGGTWFIQRKDVNVFAQVNTPVIRLLQPGSTRKIAVFATTVRIGATGQDITGLSLFDAAGRQIASIKQHAGPAIAMDVSKSGRQISPGIYVARVFCKDGATSLHVSIRP